MIGIYHTVILMFVINVAYASHAYISDCETCVCMTAGSRGLIFKIENVLCVYLDLNLQTTCA